jgi:hypothetical protein
MESEPLSTVVLGPRPQPEVPPIQAWLARLGLSGKLLAIGGLVGVIAVFLPLLSVSMQIQAPGDARGGVNFPSISSSQTVMVVGNWRGVLCLVGYLAAISLSVVLYPPKGLAQKTLGWAGVGVGGFIVLLALWLLVSAINGSAGMSAFGSSLKISVGIGAIFNLLAGLAVAAGGVLKAREENLIPALNGAR